MRPLSTEFLEHFWDEAEGEEGASLMIDPDNTKLEKISNEGFESIGLRLIDNDNAKESSGLMQGP